MATTSFLHCCLVIWYEGIINWGMESIVHKQSCWNSGQEESDFGFCWMGRSPRSFIYKICVEKLVFWGVEEGSITKNGVFSIFLIG